MPYIAKVQFTFGGVHRRIDDYVALALLACLEDHQSDIALEIARSLSRALARELAGSPTDIVLDEVNQAELQRVLDDWNRESPLPDELRWLRLALHGEQLPWEVPRDRIERLSTFRTEANGPT